MPTYLVFGRTEFEQPLTQQGRFDADGPADARARALADFGDDWVQLSLVPGGDVRWIIGPDPEAEQEVGA